MGGGFLDIMRHSTLRIQVLIMYFNWFTTAFIMYGLALSWQNLTGGLFLTFFIERDVYPSNWPIVVLALIGNFCTTMCFAILYMYTGELMPTTVRAAGVGSSSLVSKLGGTLSTTVAALADIHPAIPTLIFTVMAITSGFLTLFLPETRGIKMPESFDDVERVQIKMPWKK